LQLEKQAAGLLIQKLPETKETQYRSNILGVSENDYDNDIDGWNRIQQLSATIKDEELLELNAEEIIHRLYHEEDIRMFDAEGISFRCHCSRERVADMLLSLGAEEVQNMIKDLNKIEVACEFCNHNYSFDAVDTEQLFSSEVAHQAPKAEQ
jgi:molecular chaperone Hsp33